MMKAKWLLLCASCIFVAHAGCSSNANKPAPSVMATTEADVPTHAESDPAHEEHPAPSVQIPEDLMTPALVLFGAPFEKPINYKINGPEGEEIATRTITVELTEGNKVRIKAEWTGSLAAAGAEVYESTKMGIKAIRFGNSDVTPASMVLPANPKAGDTWTVNYSVDVGGGLAFSSRAKVVGREKVKVPLGEFNALLVEDTGTIKGRRAGPGGSAIDWKQTTRTWLVENVGMVKLVMSYRGKTGDKTQNAVREFVAVLPPGQ